MGRLGIAVLCSALLCAVLASSQVSVCVAEEKVVVREGRTEPAAPSSYFKSWSDWALGKTGKKVAETPVQHAQTPDSAATGGWSDWALKTVSSFSGRATKDAGKVAEKAAQAGKETAKAGKDKLKAEGEAAAKEGQDMWEGAKGGAKEGTEKTKEYASEYAGKAKEGVHHQAGKTYESGKDMGSQTTQKVKEEAEL